MEILQDGDHPWYAQCHRSSPAGIPCCWCWTGRSKAPWRESFLTEWVGDYEAMSFSKTGKYMKCLMLVSMFSMVFPDLPRSNRVFQPQSWIWQVILLNFCAYPPNAWGKISRGEAFFRQVDPSTSRVTQALQRCLAGSNWWDTDGLLVPKGRAGRG